MKKMIMYVFLLLTMFVTLGCAEDEATSTPEKPEETEEVAADETTTEEEPETQEENKETEDPVPSQETTEKEKETTTASETPETETQPSSNEANKDLFSGYERIDVDGGDQSGDRASRVVVDIGYGDREYWAFTNVKLRYYSIG
ncbi:hypothetical protein AAV35_004380 [Salimicrobium jeotgali]|uniref:Lipoprotein n=1 Tax=Salimicrobium jeotgali TaxID=1230341 RepID=K2FJJ6_9BACI|nr:hypothetical protein [Salimicrobium jeotgali]APC65578.1 hypothetical protein AAV35_004380 [Salimicrobium jeotgali]EKE31221.1 hypothetical protein MJ3_09633 [Salimicrobium jeotgali]MBM7697218.1 cobalamin biosynthesis protein CobT [Salimicrobium jeotgali]